MYLLTIYKLRLRSFIFYEAYSSIVDTVRYVVLVIAPCVMLVSAVRMLQRDRKKEARESVRWFTFAIFFMNWAMVIVCVIFGQKELDRVWKVEYHLIPRVVNPAACVGTIAVVWIFERTETRHLEEGERKVIVRGIDPAQWGLIWAIEILTVVW